MSPDQLSPVDAYGIELTDVDERDRFARPPEYVQRDPHPAECFYVFKGLELLAERGFAYSVAVDGDTFCSHRFDIQVLVSPPVEGF